MSEIVPDPHDGEADPVESITGLIDEQDAEAQAFAAEFLKKVLRIRGVKIEREAFLRQELRKIGLSNEAIDSAIESTPLEAGVSIADLDGIAGSSISFETRKSAAVSFATGLPGGLAMLASVPGDVIQYYVHAFRVMQKLSYIYGWRDFLGDLDEADDETVGKVAVFLGVMMGVGGAAASFTTFAQQVARPALQKQVAKQALTKNAWYVPMKKTLAMVGVRVTKDSFAKTVTKAVPVAGGVISGGMTLVSLGAQSKRLQQHLRELPPPGVDAAEYRAALQELDSDSQEGGALASAKESLGRAAQDAGSTVKDVAGSASASAKEAAGRARSSAGALLRKGSDRLSRRKDADAEEPDEK